MFHELGFSVGSQAAEKRLKAWSRVRKSPELTVPKVMSLANDTQVMAIGSCFVNEIRAVLERAELAVHPLIDPAIGPLFSDQVKCDASWGAWDERAHYQCFTPFTVQQEIEFAFGGRRPDPELVLKRSRKGRTIYIDPYRRNVIADSPRQVLEIRERMSRQMRLGFDNSDILIVTLGLVEAFRLRGHDLYLSEYKRVIGDQDMEFFDAGHGEVMASIQRSVDLLRSAYPQKPIVFTVSPIPIRRTFSGTDAITATTRAKSILRGCVDSVCRSHENIHYWPSYEFAMWSDNAFREDDQRHLRPEAVAIITKAFCRAFFDPRVAQRIDSHQTASNPVSTTSPARAWPRALATLKKTFRRAA